MLSVLCIIHHQGQRLPERRLELLRKCIDVRLHEWRATQGVQDHILGDLDATKQRTLLQPLALAMLKARVVEFSRPQVQEVFQAHLTEEDQPTEQADVLRAPYRATEQTAERAPYPAIERAAGPGMMPCILGNEN